MKRFVLLILYAISFLPSVAQTDSLFAIALEEKYDTAVVRRVAELVKQERKNSRFTTGVNLAQKAINFLNEKKQLDLAGPVYIELGVIYEYSRRFDSAQFWYQESLLPFIKTGNAKGLGSAYLNLGILSVQQNKEVKAIEYFSMAERVFDYLHDGNALLMVFVNSALTYVSLNDFVNGSKYLHQSRNMAIDQEKFGLLAAIDQNLAILHFKQENFDSAHYYCSKILPVFEQAGALIEQAEVLEILGAIERNRGQLEKAEHYYDKAVGIRNSVGMPIPIELMNNLASLFIEKKNYTRAQAYLDEVYSILQSKPFGSYPLSNLEHNLQNRMKLAHLRGDYKSAYDLSIQYSAIRDTIYNKAKLSELSDFKTQLEVQKREDEVRREEAVKAERLSALSEEKSKRQWLIISAVLFVLVLSVVFALMLWRRFRVTQRQNAIIELQRSEVLRQKHIVDEKNKEVMDSIAYAKRLQSAILPPVSALHQYFQDAFVLYKPKDIVAGDFYFLDAVESRIYFAVADCTGHGVPGAMVSVVCSNALSRAVNEFGIPDPGEILDKVTDIVLDTFSRGGEEVRDGMDISLGCFDTQTRELRWSGANNGIVYFRNGEMHELKGDKQPVGKYMERKKFSTHLVRLEKGDRLFLFSDGYGDQFGGEITNSKAGGKKFKEGNLKKLFQEIHQFPMHKQEELLWEKSLSWRGELEQIDDICIMGIEI